MERNGGNEKVRGYGISAIPGIQSNESKDRICSVLFR